MKQKPKGFTVKQPRFAVKKVDDTKEPKEVKAEVVPKTEVAAKDPDPLSEYEEIKKEILATQLPRPRPKARERDLIDRIFGLYPEEEVRDEVDELAQLARAEQKARFLTAIKRQACEQVMQMRKLGLAILDADIERIRKEVMLHPDVSKLMISIQVGKMRSEDLKTRIDNLKMEKELANLEKNEVASLRIEQEMLQLQKKIEELKSEKKESEIEEVVTNTIEDIIDLAKEKEKKSKKT